MQSAQVLRARCSLSSHTLKPYRLHIYSPLSTFPNAEHGINYLVLTGEVCWFSCLDLLLFSNCLVCWALPRLTDHLFTALELKLSASWQLRREEPQILSTLNRHI